MQDRQGLFEFLKTSPQTMVGNQIVWRINGGQTGIRTLETVARLHAFQACAFDHSATCPKRSDGQMPERVN